MPTERNERPWASNRCARFHTRVGLLATATAVLILAGCSSAPRPPTGSSAPGPPTGSSTRATPLSLAALDAGLDIEYGVHSGEGNATLGPFTLDGAVEVHWICVGPGLFTESMSAGGGRSSSQFACDGSENSDQEPYWCPLPTTLTVTASAASRWSIDVVSMIGSTHAICPTPSP